MEPKHSHLGASFVRRKKVSVGEAAFWQPVYQQGGNRSGSCRDSCYRGGHLGRDGGGLSVGFCSVRYLYGTKRSGGRPPVFPSPLALLRCFDFLVAPPISQAFQFYRESLFAV
ncbi:hypothetical protein D3C75_1107050 [compost metagenome]